MKGQESVQSTAPWESLMDSIEPERKAWMRNMSSSASEICWDLKPRSVDLRSSACTWTVISSSNKIQRNYEGLKITACMPSWA